MMLLAVMNIILRFVWEALPGSYDYMEFIGATLVSFAIAYCAVKRGHIEVEMLVERLPQRVQGFIGVFTGILSLGIFSIITWQLILFGNDMRRQGETSMTALLPFYPYIYGLALGVGLLCLVILAQLARQFEKAAKG